jgi:beta-lactamase regulating signal transducer with metallopeptidase domain
MNLLQTLSGAEWLPFLAVLAAKATLVMLLTAAAAALLGRASAAARHMVWCVGVVGVLALPMLAVLLPAWDVPVLPPAQSAAAPLAAPPPGEGLVANPPVFDRAHTELAGAPARPWMPSLSAVVAGVIVGGSAVGLLWLAIGFWGVTRLGRSAEVVNDPHWLSAAQDAASRLGLRRPVLLLRSRGAVMPACWGLLWPSVIVPATADAWPEDRKRAVLAHELAHVKRFDCLTQALAQLACVLLWWHPAVWYAARRLRIERERACDDLVLGAGARPSEYAAHLLEIARDHRGMGMAAPALVSMARPSHLESRLLWVLDGARARTVPSTRALLLAMLVGTVVVGPLAALRPAVAADGPEARQASAAPRGPDAYAAPVPPDAAAVPGPLPTLVAVAPAGGEEAGSVAWIGGGGDPPAGGGLNVGGIVGTVFGALPSVGDALRSALAADTPNVTIDELIAMRALGVDARYIQEMRAAGYSDLSNDQLMGMRAIGVTGRFASEMNAAGMGRLTPEELIGLRTMGVTPAFMDALRRRGYTDLRADALTGLRAMGVTPEYIDEMNALGHGRLSADMLIALKAVGVTPAYVRELERMGLGRPPLGEVKGLRTLGVTGAYVAELRDAGVRPLTAETLAGLRAMDVTGAYVRELAAAGLTDLSADDLTALRAMGVTGAYVREMAAAGYRNLTAERLLDLRAGGGASRHRDRTRRP